MKFKGKVTGEIRPVRVVRTSLRVKLQLICEPPERAVVDNTAPVGMEVGVSKLLTLSNGTRVNGRTLDRSKLKRQQRALARAVKGSCNRQQKLLALRNEWQRITERRNGFNHELTAALNKEHSNRFFVEGVNIVTMTRSAKGTVDELGCNVSAKAGLKRSILEQSWGDFIAKLNYQGARAGGYVLKVDPKFTSQNCSSCGAEKSHNKKVYAIFECRKCGHVADRDVNASMNVLQRGLASLSGGIPGVYEAGRLNRAVA